MTTPTKLRAALYARFSTDLQKDRSIDDQFLYCETIATRAATESEKIKIEHRYGDKALSSTTMVGRDQFARLMLDAKAKKFDVLITESLDRISRDQEDLANMYRKLTYCGVKILTGSEGYVN